MAHHAVPTRVLGRVERRVGGAEQVVDAVEAAIVGARDADADGDRRIRRRAFLHGPAQRLREFDCLRAIGARQDHRELLAAVAAHAVAAPDALLQLRRHQLQHLVSAGVAVAVVKLLEVVDVDDQQRERATAAPAALELADRHFVEEAAVRHAGQRVGEALPAQVAQAAREREREQHHLEQRADLEAVLGQHVVRQQAEHLQHVGHHADQQQAPCDHEVARRAVTLHEADRAHHDDQRGHDDGQQRKRQDQQRVRRNERGRKREHRQPLQRDREPVELRQERAGAEEGARELHAEHERQRQQHEQGLVAPGRAVGPQVLEREAVVHREVEAVARRVQEVVEDASVAHDHEQEEVVQHQHEEAAVVRAVGELLVAERTEQRMPVVQREAEVDRPARGRAQVERALRLRRDVEVEQEVAVRILARAEHRAVAGARALPAATPPFAPEVEVVDQRIVLAQHGATILGRRVREREAHPPGRAREAEVGAEPAHRAERTAIAHGFERHRGIRVLEHVHCLLERGARKARIDPQRLGGGRRGRQYQQQQREHAQRMHASRAEQVSCTGPGHVPPTSGCGFPAG